VATLILVRHGRSSANAEGVLAGRTPGVSLDDTGSAQAAAAGRRLAGVPLAAVVSSPLDRCRQTAKAIVAARTSPLRIGTDKGLTECDYGDWTGRSLRELAKERLWTTIQAQPSAVTFPGGESMAEMQARAVAAVRHRDAAVGSAHGKDAIWVAVSHGDIIKSILADAFGMHLDLFQRIRVDPASVSIVRYSSGRPEVVASNTHDGDLAWLAAPARKRPGGRGDAVVGGGSGPA
jgi:probable phosphomutase (TIGR03848 family)